MDMKGITSWVEDHPTESIVIGLGGTLAILWLLGFFSSSTQSADSGSSNLAAAYYAAEAQQAVVGGQIQMANIAATASTAQSLIGANAAVAINAANSTAATTINGQNATAATTINQSNNDAAATLNGQNTSEQLLATYSNNWTAYNTALSNNATAATISADTNRSSIWQTIFGSLLPTELALGKGYAQLDLGSFAPGGVGGVATISSINDLMAGGMTRSQAEAASHVAGL
jgi:hypothetical protein